MKDYTLHPNLIRQLFILSLIIFIGYLISNEIMPYLSGILGAVTLYVLFNKWMNCLLKKGWPAWLAATLLILFSIVILLIPIAGISIIFITKLKSVFDNTDELTSIINEKINEIDNSIPFFDISSSINSNKIAVWLSNYVQSVADSTFNISIALTIMYFLLYYMLVHRNELRGYLMMYIPLSDKNISILAKESRSIVKSNAIGIPLVALIQGIIALIGYYIFGVPNAMLWFVVTFVGSMIPFIGTFLAIAPVTLIMMSQGNTTAAYGILIYGVVVVGSSDNLFRIFVQNRLANLHPLITLVGVIIGVPLFGFIGLIFGPLLISLFLLLLKIYKGEYGKNEEELARENTAILETSSTTDSEEDLSKL